ncbi:MAG: hypothetical protein Q9160_000946 [Pyrenula sp. 1 TL-2023]
MGKKKAKKDRPLTHDEIWDDSALIRSWDEAVEDIHARGEDVEEVLRSVATDDMVLDKPAQNVASSETSNRVPRDVNADTIEVEEIEDCEIEDNDIDQSAGTGPAAPPKTTAIETSGPGNTGSGSTDLDAAAVPHEVLSGQNDNLKNLMMAWYWAGYYTRQAEEQEQQ